MSIVPTPASDRARFWAKVDKNGPVPEACPELGPCWLWIGALFTGSGYGQFWLRNRNRRAHVVSYEWANGSTDGQQVQHLCNVRICVRPAHLTTGTPAQNTAYAVQHGRMASGERHWLRKGPDTRRHARGERNGTAKLTEADVRTIKQQRAAGVTRKAIAAQYGIAYWTVRDIDTGRIWQHVT